ncbi:MAG: 7-cyano-7-deazaguanine synthase [Planctomycetia bacterium]|nr:7-cyano-7-deazaguanine synthase [Planctomycetia bacterium]
MKTNTPSFWVSFSDGAGNCRHLLAENHFTLHRGPFYELFKQTMPARMADLLRIAIAVYAVDRVAKRQRRNWARSLSLEITVRDAEFWARTPVRDSVLQCIEFVAGEDWQLRFLPESSGGYDAARPLPGIPAPFEEATPIICLYSGGLDSAAGLACRLQDSSRPVIPVTVWHQSAQKELVESQLQRLQMRFRVQLKSLFVPARLYPSTINGRQERSQRCRSFLFASVGGVAAYLGGAACVEVYESGVGALNLPLMAGMVGSRTTRSCHPEFLRRMSGLLTTLTDREFTYQLPFVNMTKGEMVKCLVDNGLSDVAQSTVSCVHHPLREKPHKQCGVCAACIFRRQAMLTAGVSERPGTYKFDLFGQPSSVNEAPESKLKYLAAFLLQLLHLGELRADAELPARIRRHLFGSAILARGQSPQSIVDLLGRYRGE